MPVTKSTYSGFFVIFLLILLLGAIVIQKFECLKKNIITEASNSKSDLPNLAKAFNANKNFSCEEEKEYILATLDKIKTHVNYIYNTYYEIHNDRWKWSMYVGKWNREAQKVSDESKDEYFKCVHSKYFEKVRNDYTQLGNLYAYSKYGKIIDGLRLLKTDMNATFEEIMSK